MSEIGGLSQTIVRLLTAIALAVLVQSVSFGAQDTNLVTVIIGEPLSTSGKVAKYKEAISRVVAKRNIGRMVGDGVRETIDHKSYRIDIEVANIEQAITILKEDMKDLDVPEHSYLEFRRLDGGVTLVGFGTPNPNLVTIKITEPLMTGGKESRYKTAIIEVLAKRKIGKLVGDGVRDERDRKSYAMDIEIFNLQQANQILKEELRNLRAPQGTSLRYRSGGNEIWESVMPESIPVSAIPSQSYEQAKAIFPDGEQDHCFDGPYRAKKKDRWLVMVNVGDKWLLTDAVITSEGRVEAKDGKAAYFFKHRNLPLKNGPIATAEISSIPTGNVNVSEVVFIFQDETWKWVEWGVREKSFFLSNGKTKWTLAESSGKQSKRLARLNVDVPPSYRKRTSPTDRRGRDYENGSYKLVWAGDLNADGLLDLIVAWSGKETWGHHLWLGEGTARRTSFRLALNANDGCS